MGISDYNATDSENKTVPGSPEIEFGEGLAGAPAMVQALRRAVQRIMADLKTASGKLDGIEANATADQSGAEIKAAYEGEADTNAFTDAEQTKVGYITITGAVNLDSVNTRVNELDAAIVLKGTWDASSGSFPGSGSAQAGESWIVSTGGTVDGVAFVADDRLIAITDNASTSTFASNWHKADYTDLVASVAGLTGTISASGLIAALGIDEAIEFVIDGGGSAITTGVKGDLEIPVDCTVTQVTMLADQSGSIVVDIWKDSYANYPPTDADSITASAVPTIATATKSQDATLTGWTTSISAGDILRFNVDSVTSIERVTVSLKVTRT